MLYIIKNFDVILPDYYRASHPRREYPSWSQLWILKSDINYIYFNTEMGQAFSIVERDTVIVN